ncbi:class I SAM-dependent methyltransferase [Nitrososphaera sp. AFS]|jgi:2-polyprenyl-3-methyl-5-hydroxy-6-metoxy-1,4-benzoquinol methylase|uniref:class I SAM-dependent methyltransferase n=1 Tax=Nitrososphaera sp. AFS TaxID=2301191 RepID=UPI0013924914|nr:class I SAM-dependent methyltransferase [Nitrososphaera sp. AFS]NAL78855.1 class I SAM-dependent methyltransferase [Nitrososphaera sp. AFS]
MTSSQSTIGSEEKVQQFMEKVLSDFGGAASLILAYIGDKLGLYKAMHDFGKPISSEELASFSGTSERYIREWLANQAAGGYLTYDASSQKYVLPSEHAQALVNEDSPTYVAGGFQVMMSLCRDEAKFLDIFKTGKGIAWGDHDKDLYQGTERFFKPLYTANLVSSWIPALDNNKVEQRLKQKGLKVADIGCGHGISTILMAKAYPNSKFYGFDNHTASIEYARKKAKEEGLGEDRIQFEVASSTNFPSPQQEEETERKEGGVGYDLITFFDCLHDMEDPQGAAAHALSTLTKPDGTVMIVEPFANDKLEDNLNPVGRLLYAASTMVCIPTSLSQNGPALGAQAGEAGISKVVKAGGFKYFKRAAQTPFNIVYEAKP